MMMMMLFQLFVEISCRVLFVNMCVVVVVVIVLKEGKILDSRGL